MNDGGWSGTGRPFSSTLIACALLAVWSAGCEGPLSNEPGLVVADRIDWSVLGRASDDAPWPGARVLDTQGVDVGDVRWRPGGRGLALIPVLGTKTQRAQLDGTPVECLPVLDERGQHSVRPAWRATGGEGGDWLQDGDAIVAGSSSTTIPVVVTDMRVGVGADSSRVRITTTDVSGVGSDPAVSLVSGRIVSVLDAGRSLGVARPDARPPRSNPMDAPAGGPWLFDRASFEALGVDASAPIRDPSWAPDGSGVVFTIAGAGVFEVDSQGANPRRLLQTPQGADDRSPVVDPDFDRVWFIRRIEGGAPQLWSVPRPGVDGERSSARPEQAADGVRAVRFSPDGAWCALVLERAGGGQVAVAPNPSR
jgi:hypothetical protein